MVPFLQFFFVLSVKKRKKEKTFLAACIRLYYIALANRHRNHFGQTPKHFEPEMGENGKVVTLEISSQLLELYASIKRRTFAFRTMHNSEIVFHHQWSLLCLLTMYWLLLIWNSIQSYWLLGENNFSFVHQLICHICMWNVVHMHIYYNVF